MVTFAQPPTNQLKPQISSFLKKEQFQLSQSLHQEKEEGVCQSPALPLIQWASQLAQLNHEIAQHLTIVTLLTDKASFSVTATALLTAETETETEVGDGDELQTTIMSIPRTHWEVLAAQLAQLRQLHHLAQTILTTALNQELVSSSATLAQPDREEEEGS